MLKTNVDRSAGERNRLRGRLRRVLQPPSPRLRCIKITGDVNHGFVVTGDATTVNLFAADDPGDRRPRYLAELAAAASNLPWASVDSEFADPGATGPG